MAKTEGTTGKLTTSEVIGQVPFYVVSALCVSFWWRDSPPPESLFSWIKVATQIYLAAYVSQQVFGFGYAAYFLYVKKLPTSMDPDLKTDEIYAILFPDSEEAQAVAQRTKCEIDHLVYTCHDLNEGMSTIQKLTGVKPKFGGKHASLGTHNALLSLGETCYLEIIAPDPEAAEKKPGDKVIFGNKNHHLATFCCHPSTRVKGSTIEVVSAAMQLAGKHPGPISDMSRRLPSGKVLEWRFTSPWHATESFPFLIDWASLSSSKQEQNHHPAKSSPQGCRLERLTLYTKHEEDRTSLYQKIGLLKHDTRIQVTKRQDDYKEDYLEAEIDTPKNGLVKLGGLTTPQ